MAQSRSLSNTVDHVTGHWIRQFLPTLAFLGCGNARPPRNGSTYHIEPPPCMHHIEITPPRGTNLLLLANSDAANSHGVQSVRRRLLAYWVWVQWNLGFLSRRRVAGLYFRSWIAGRQAVTVCNAYISWYLAIGMTVCVYAGKDTVCLCVSSLARL
jgi:hypothetical protein